jgi:hypothetical protein
VTSFLTPRNHWLYSPPRIPKERQCDAWSRATSILIVACNGSSPSSMKLVFRSHHPLDVVAAVSVGLS